MKRDEQRNAVHRTEKKPIGRPRTLAERPERKGISLQPSEWAMLREYGGGYAGGIRRLIVEQRGRAGAR